jgi:hypothetical protein
MDADELEDYLELRDPKVREHMRKSNEEYLAGKGRPVEECLCGEKTGKGKRSTAAGDFSPLSRWAACYTSRALSSGGTPRRYTPSEVAAGPPPCGWTAARLSCLLPRQLTLQGSATAGRIRKYSLALH